jgi:hypothetical protein
MLKLVMTQGYTFAANDYGRVHAFKIYNEDDTPFDVSTYNAPSINVFDQNGSIILSITGSWTVQNQGTGTFAFTESNRLTAPGPHYLEVQLDKISTIVSTERRRITVTP